MKVSVYIEYGEKNVYIGAKFNNAGLLIGRGKSKKEALLDALDTINNLQKSLIDEMRVALFND